MERKRTNFKMYKIGRRWAFACAILLTLGSSTVIANADTDAGNGSVAGNNTVTGQASSTSDDLTSQQAPLKSGTDTSDDQSATGSEKGSQTDQSGVKPSDPVKPADVQKATQPATPATDDQKVQQPVVPVSESDDQPDSGKVEQPADQSSDTVKSPVAPVSASLKSTTPTANSAVKDGGTVEDDYPDLHNLLGISSQFHIFAREADLGTHTNGNVAVGNLIGNVNFGTNIIEELLDKDISYIQNVTNIAGSSFVSAGDTRVNKVIFGENVEIDVSNPNRPKINGTDIDHLLAEEVYQDKNGNVYIDFDKEFALLEQLNAALSEKTPVANYTASDFPDMNNRVIDVSDLQPDKDGKIVINLSADVLAGNTPLTIKGLSTDKDGNTVIINVDTEGATDYSVNSPIKIIYDDGSDRNSHETEYFGDNHLLWNFYDSTAADKLVTGKVDFNAVFQGSVLAPAAEVTANQNLDGNIIADKVNVRGETHRWDLQDNVDNEKDPDDFDKPVHPSIDVDFPGIDTPGKPGIDVELPNYEYEKPVAPSIDVEMPDFEYEKPGTPGIGVEMPTIEEEIQEEEELEEEFEETLDDPVGEQIGEDQTLLTEIDREIETAQASGDTAVVKQLEALKARVEAALKVAKGESLPQTGERSTNPAMFLGLVLASVLAFSGVESRRRKHQN
ncbi:collagen-binding domain-containing protein [Lactiplantibacillus daoliensis]|uniref:Collagen-binding domain-containing protein n=1 Tax=Lactiplantibacillus daoliensis TaxID=2559916 RepID=A0ABW1UJN2_9LACO|nr:collagen-binding domain-containing protein [Lactiplantibacillus daoliensis]